MFTSLVCGDLKFTSLVKKLVGEEVMLSLSVI